MSESIPEKFLDLFQKRAFANLATLMPDGAPQVTPVWCDFDGNSVLINTAVGRVKDKNLQREPRVSLAILDPDNPYRYLEIRGRTRCSINDRFHFPLVVDHWSFSIAEPAVRSMENGQWKMGNSMINGKNDQWKMGNSFSI